MARQTVECIFCGNLPCTCVGSAPQSRTWKKKPSPPAPVVPTVAPSEVSDTLADDFFKEATTKFSKKVAARDKEFTSVADIEMREALRCLYSILCPRDQVQAMEVIKPKLKPAIARKLREWRKFNGERKHVAGPAAIVPNEVE